MPVQSEELITRMRSPAQNREVLNCELATEILRISGELRFVARGTSMIPEIFPQDLLLVRNAGVESLCKGDVALWTRDGRFFAHRVVRAANPDYRDAIITQGDALPYADQAVQADEILGHVYAIVRRHACTLLTSRPRLSSQTLAFLVRYSDFGAKWLLRYNTLRWQLSARAQTAKLEQRPGLGQCL